MQLIQSQLSSESACEGQFSIEASLPVDRQSNYEEGNLQNPSDNYLCSGRDHIESHSQPIPAQVHRESFKNFDFDILKGLNEFFLIASSMTGKCSF